MEDLEPERVEEAAVIGHGGGGGGGEGGEGASVSVGWCLLRRVEERTFRGDASCDMARTRATYSADARARGRNAGCTFFRAIVGRVGSVGGGAEGGGAEGRRASGEFAVGSWEVASCLGVFCSTAHSCMHVLLH